MKNIVIIFSFLIFGCGARKVEKQETKQQIEKEVVSVETKIDTTSIKENIVEQKNIKVTDLSAENSLIYTPIDTSKVMVITDNKGEVFKFKNVKLTSVKKSAIKTKIDSSKTTTNKNTNSLSEQIKKATETTKTTSVTKGKQIKRESSFSWFWIILIITLIVIAIRYRKKIWQKNLVTK